MVAWKPVLSLSAGRLPGSFAVALEKGPRGWLDTILKKAIDAQAYRQADAIVVLKW